MYAQAEKKKENKSRLVANNVAQKKSKAEQGLRFSNNRLGMVGQRKIKNSICSGVIQRVPIAGIEVVKSANMPQWVQNGLTYHLNVTTDPSHITCEDWPTGETKKKKPTTTKMHFFFKGSQGSIKDAISGQRNQKKFSDLPKDVQKFVNENYNAILGVE